MPLTVFYFRVLTIDTLAEAATANHLISSQNIFKKTKQNCIFSAYT